MEPLIQRVPEFYVVGISTFGNVESGLFPKAWEMFFKLEKDVEWNDDEKAFGIEFYTEEFHKEGKWFYMACKEVADLKSIPANMVGKVIPENYYATFTCEGLSSLKNTFQFAYREWLPKSNYVPAGWYDFELYDERFLGCDNPESIIDIYIPVKKK
jgi:AraC family transcriptional regulator